MMGSITDTLNVHYTNFQYEIIKPVGDKKRPDSNPREGPARTISNSKVLRGADRVLTVRTRRAFCGAPWLGDH